MTCNAPGAPAPRADPPAISRGEAASLIQAAREGHLEDLLRRAGAARAEAFGPEVGLCAIVNAKSGWCTEDCSFCAQSRLAARAGVPTWPLRSSGFLADAARRAEAAGASAFSVVTSGRAMAGEPDLAEFTRALTALTLGTSLLRCASLGLLEEHDLRRLRAAGLERYHCNLETSSDFFPRICTTHGFDEKLETIAAAKRAGLSACSGGIFGVGESPEQRVALPSVLCDLEVDAVPINFLDPRPGTPLGGQPLLSPEECLATIAVFRLLLPNAEIIVMGGREVQLGNMQRDIFRAGASGTLVGDYLTTRGSAATSTVALVDEQGFEVRRHRQVNGCRAAPE